MTDGLIALLERIREHLNELATAPLSDEDLAHLVAIEDWLGDLAKEAVDA
jgi:hypothetical protein